MCISAKDSLLALCVMLGISIALIVRNKQFDRLMASLLIIVSLIQLCEFLFHSHTTDSNITGRLIFLTLWLQVAVLGIALYYFFRTTFTLIWMIIFIIVMLVALYYSVKLKFCVREEGGHLVWSQAHKDGRKGILGGFSWLYLVGLIGPFLVIEFYENWRNVSIWLFILAVALSIVFVKWKYPAIVFSSMWCYSAIFICFVAYLGLAFTM